MAQSRSWWLADDDDATEDWEETQVLRYLARTLNRLEMQMSVLTDQIDTALALLAQETVDAQARFDAATAAQVAATGIIQGQLDASKAGETLDEAELQKALDGLTKANATLATLGQPPVVVPPVTPPVTPPVA